MSRILVLGGGQMGSVIATDLATDHDVTVADRRALEIAGVAAVTADLEDREVIEALARKFDFVVGALPASLGFVAARAAVAAGKNYVDVAFFAEDARELHAEAVAAKVAVLPDCGLAPGISNLVAGRATAAAPRQNIHIRVGGISEEPSRPFGIIVSWSVDDLVDEYVRPTRYLDKGKVVTVPALTGIERVNVDGIGQLEAFFTDGLRTLLTLEGVRTMTEKTMRWPGHLDQIAPYLAAGTLGDEIRRRAREGRDLVVMVIDVDDTRVTLVARATDSMSAMARTTALTTAAFARWVATGNLVGVGVIPPENIGADPEAFCFILGALAQRGIELHPRLPFV